MGTAGYAIGDVGRRWLGIILGGAVVVVGVVQIAGRRVKPPQRDRETPFNWVHAGPIKWATATGVAIGLGFSTRIGFWAWYLVPAGALLVADPVWGGIIYGGYALIRSSGAMVIAGISSRTGREVRDIGSVLVTRLTPAVRYSAIHSLVVGALVAALA